MNEFGAQLEEILGAGNVLAGDAIEPRYIVDIYGTYAAHASFVVRPGTTAEVSAIMRAAGEQELPVTVIGGLTNPNGAATCPDGGIILSLERMNSIVEIDRQAMTVTVEAGAILADRTGSRRGARASARP